MSGRKLTGPAKLSIGGKPIGEVNSVTHWIEPKCDSCLIIGPTISFEFRTPISHAMLTHAIICAAPPEAYLIVEDGHERQATDAEREAYKAGMAAQFN